MTYFHPAWLEHQRKRFTRADAYRFAAPEGVESIRALVTRARFLDLAE